MGAIFLRPIPPPRHAPPRPRPRRVGATVRGHLPRAVRVLEGRGLHARRQGLLRIPRRPAGDHIHRRLERRTPRRPGRRRAPRRHAQGDQTRRLAEAAHRRLPAPHHDHLPRGPRPIRRLSRRRCHHDPQLHAHQGPVRLRRRRRRHQRGRHPRPRPAHLAGCGLGPPRRYPLPGHRRPGRRTQQTHPRRRGLPRPRLSAPRVARRGVAPGPLPPPCAAHASCALHSPVAMGLSGPSPFWYPRRRSLRAGSTSVASFRSILVPSPHAASFQQLPTLPPLRASCCRWSRVVLEFVLMRS
mmetsp:Transcript_5378/g.13812  ORF Transcript_5378/g.13812 Transcript_5378/m.13812 type:complete len:298 (+) Transcript_5378:277-1170(+)